MESLSEHLLSIVTFLPLAGAAGLLLVPAAEAGIARAVALVFSLASAVASFIVLYHFDPGFSGMQYEVDVSWLPHPAVSYHMGVDGISLFLVLLTTVLTPVVILSSWTAVKDRVREFMVCMLMLETGMLGALLALDMFLFFLFWELMLIPMYLIIGVWGGERRIYASVKFFIYTALGSVFMLLAILFMYWKSGDPQTGARTFDVLRLYGVTFSPGEQRFLFLAMGLAFAIKVPMFPFHTWLPDAHVEAPTAGSVILAAVLLKMGTYGFLRFAMPLFPDAAWEFMPWVAGIAVVGIIYGAMMALVQKDLKKLVAYSSISHLGLVMLGVCSLGVTGMTGAVYQMLNHGVSTGGLFLMVGVLYERRHTRLIAEYGGLAGVVPRAAAVFLVICLSSIGLPGTNGFVGEFLTLMGSFVAPVFNFAMINGRWFVYLAVTGVVLGAVYMLWAYQKVMFGPVTNDANKGLADLSSRELLVFLPVLFLIFYMGIHTTFFTDRIAPSVTPIAVRMTDHTGFDPAKTRPELTPATMKRLKERLQPGQGGGR
jgi:NADH-quinone oxidoreductase subunit M